MDLAIQPWLDPTSLISLLKANHAFIDVDSLLVELRGLMSSYIFLGRPMPTHPVPPDDPAGPSPTHYDDPTAVLAFVKHAWPIDRRRAIYAKALVDLIADHPDNTVLSAEYNLFHKNLAHDLHRRGLLGEGALVVPETDHMGVKHWRWHGHRGGRSPEGHTNALGAKGIPIYRLLWPYYRPEYPIPVGRRPVRDRSVCLASEEDDAYPCVYPGHFTIPALGKRLVTRPLMLASGKPSNYVRRSGLPSDNVGWYEDRVGTRFCAPRHHRLSEHYQHLEHMPRTAYCAMCYRIRAEERRESSQRRKPGEYSENARTFAAWVDAEASANELPPSLPRPQIEGDDGVRTI